MLLISLRCLVVELVCVVLLFGMIALLVYYLFSGWFTGAVWCMVSCCFVPI